MNRARVSWLRVAAVTYAAAVSLWYPFARARGAADRAETAAAVRYVVTHNDATRRAVEHAERQRRDRCEALRLSIADALAEPGGKVK